MNNLTVSGNNQIGFEVIITPTKLRTEQTASTQLHFSPSIQIARIPVRIGATNVKTVASPTGI